MLVVERGDGLQIEDEHRRALLLHDRQHLRGGGIGADIADEQIEILPREPLARLPPRNRRIHQPGGDHLRAQLRQVRLNVALIACQPLAQPRKLWPIRRQPDPEHPHPRRQPLLPLHPFPSRFTRTPIRGIVSWVLKSGGLQLDI